VPGGDERLVQGGGRADLVQDGGDPADLEQERPHLHLLHGRALEAQFLGQDAAENGPREAPARQGLQGGVEQEQGQRQDVDLRRLHPHPQDDLREAAGIARLHLAEEDDGVGAGQHAGSDLLPDPELELFDFMLLGILVVQDEEHGRVEAQVELLDDRFVNIGQQRELRCGDVTLQLGRKAFHRAAHGAPVGGVRYPPAGALLE